MDRGHDGGCGPKARSTMDGPQLSRQRTSSFIAIPAHLYTPSSNPFRNIHFLIPNPAASFLHERVTALATWPSYSNILKSIDVFNAQLSSKGTHDTRKPVKAALLAEGYRVTLLHALIAILINHIRRILVPWLGAFTFYHPMEDLRLALSNPDVYLDQTLSYSWVWAFSSHLQTYVFGVLAILATQVLAVNNGRLPPSTLDSFRCSPRAVIVSLEGLMHLCKIGIGVYMLMTLDYIFCRGTHTVSCLIAVYKLLAGSEAEHLALSQTLTMHWIKLPLVALMLWYYIRRALWPTFSGAVRFAVRGRPGLLITLASVASGVAATIRWRARLYILLEMSPMFVVLGSVVVMVALLVREFVNDSSRLEASTVLKRRRGPEVPAHLSAGQARSIGIVRKGTGSREGLPPRGGQDQSTRRKDDNQTRPKVDGLGAAGIGHIVSPM
ncbi:hypothetical protein CONLIGDRAFT_504037 [Coniochaeta ligniaria NRRL 30616]|uniref:Uncharacterized protein n=1 Tax=Coniochaeta ligniaria NRRL 30616 TaxID=1408157 RepID=A0A1J7JDW3_9PEZI|nr:hypothetical protein CONLIGDRAFT_504037 [Coniochaeta ligniaria NRRL 30616]